MEVQWLINGNRFSSEAFSVFISETVFLGTEAPASIFEGSDLIPSWDLFSVPTRDSQSRPLTIVLSKDGQTVGTWSLTYGSAGLTQAHLTNAAGAVLETINVSYDGSGTPTITKT